MLLSSSFVSLDMKVFDFKSIIVSLAKFKFNNHNTNEKEMEEKEILENYYMEQISSHTSNVIILLETLYQKPLIQLLINSIVQ